MPRPHGGGEVVGGVDVASHAVDAGDVDLGRRRGEVLGTRAGPNAGGTCDARRPRAASCPVPRRRRRTPRRRPARRAQCAARARPAAAPAGRRTERPMRSSGCAPDQLGGGLHERALRSSARAVRDRREAPRARRSAASRWSSVTTSTVATTSARKRRVDGVGGEGGRQLPPDLVPEPAQPRLRERGGFDRDDDTEAARRGSDGGTPRSCHARRRGCVQPGRRRVTSVRIPSTRARRTRRADEESAALT